MRFDFDMDWLCVSLIFTANFHYFPCDHTTHRTPLRDMLAFFNGGIRDGSSYGFFTEHGLLHFAFLTHQLDEYQAKWRLKYFNYHECRGDDSWF